MINVVEIGISHCAFSFSFFLRISRFPLIVKGQTLYIVVFLCTTVLLVSHIAVSVSRECYKTEAA